MKEPAPSSVKINKDFLLSDQFLIPEVMDVSTCKMFLQLLLLLQKAKTSGLRFHSITDGAVKLGYSAAGKNIKILERTIQRYGIKKVLQRRKYSEKSYDIFLQVDEDLIADCETDSVLVDVTKVDQISSPLTLKMYFFLKVTKHLKKKTFDLFEFLKDLGFAKQEFTNLEMNKLKFRMKKALAQIASIDPEYCFTLDDEAFSNQKIRFTQPKNLLY